MEAITLSKNSVLAVAALSILFSSPFVVSAQTNNTPDYQDSFYEMNRDTDGDGITDDDEAAPPRVRITARECSSLLSSGAFSLQQMEAHREWRRENTTRRPGLKAWLTAHTAFLRAQKEAQIIHTQKTIACNKYRRQLDVVSPRGTRVVLLNPNLSSFPGRLTRTGLGGNEFDMYDRIVTPQSLGITRASVRNIANFYSETAHPTKRSIQALANNAEMNRRLLR